MNVNTQAKNERQNLMSRLLDAVKQCQIRFGGKSELATETDYSITCLCSSWESVLQHGMKHTNKTLSTLKQMTEITGLNKIGSGISLLDNVETEPVFWLYVREHLNRHEVERYNRLNHVNTDAGRGRAWLRSAINEQSMEKYMHMVIEDDTIISHYYEHWAFLRDQEKRNILPNVAAGLNSILFAINIDSDELNAIRPAKGLDELLAATTSSPPPPSSIHNYAEKWEHYRPVIGTEAAYKEKRKDKKKKKKVPKIVSFDDVESGQVSSSSTSSLSSPKVFSLRSQQSDSFDDSSGVSSPTSSVGAFVAINGKECVDHRFFPGRQCSIGSDNTNLVDHEAENKNSSQFPVLNTGYKKSRSLSLSEMDSSNNGSSDISYSNQGINNNKIISDVSGNTGKVCAIKDATSSVINCVEPEIKVEMKIQNPDNLSSPTTLSNHFKEMLKFGSSDAEMLKRTSSRTSLDSVQSSKSDQIASAHQNISGNVTKGHRKSLSDTSMFVANFGSRILKTVVEKTKRSFTLGETEGSLPSSLNSSTKSLSEPCEDKATNNENREGQNNIELCSDTIKHFTMDYSLSESTVSAPVFNNTPSMLRISSFDATIGGINSKNNLPVQSVHNKNFGATNIGKVQNYTKLPLVSQFNNSSPNTESRNNRDLSFSHGQVVKNYSTPSLTRFDVDENSEVAITSDLTPISPDGLPVSDEAFRSTSRDSPVSQDNTSSSLDSTDFQSYTEVTQQATLALALAQRVFNSTELTRTQGDGSNFPDGVVSSPESQDGMSSTELKEAIIAMMKRKDEIEEHNRHLRFALEAELEVSTALRMEIDEMKKNHLSKQEKDADKIKNVSRENDLLKHQLRKYVSAVQLLRRQGAKDEDFPGIHLDNQVEPPVPPTSINRDYSHEAEQYEQKLIQVAEMHGELMEFNENLHKQLISKETLLRKLQDELTDLRGPLPADMSDPDDNLSLISEADGNYVNRPLINIWIPSAFLKGKQSDGYHVYQVYVRIRDEEWNIYRRYTDFLEMHVNVKKNSPIVSTFDFPPKKAIGNKEAKFVEMRRKKLQVYLRKVINLMSQTNVEFTANIDRNKLSTIMPFFIDKPNQNKKSKVNRRSVGNSSGQTTTQARPQPHYSGL